MKVLSLDLSTKSTGWCIFENQELIDYGLITASSTDVINRIQKITNSLRDIINKHSKIDEVIMEEVRPQGTQYGVGNQHTQKVLMWLQASVVFMLHDDFKINEIKYLYPNEWRAACGIRTGKGIKRNSLKVADIEFIKENYNLQVNDDIADAIGIGHAYTHKIKNEINWE